MSTSPDSVVGSPLPEGLKLPDLIVTRRTRTQSMSGRIETKVKTGTVKFFCRSKGHGFIDVQNGDPVFMHISDIEGEFIPRKGDKVTFQICPMPPKFDRFQAVRIKIVNFTPEVHHKWTEKETPEELIEDQQALEEERQMAEKLGSPNKTPIDV